MTGRHHLANFSCSSWAGAGQNVAVVYAFGLYGEVRPENFPGASDYRNPVVATAMKNLNYVNRFNFGIFNAQKQLEKNGNPRAEFDLNLQTKFRVTIRINRKWHA